MHTAEASDSDCYLYRQIFQLIFRCQTSIEELLKVQILCISGRRQGAGEHAGEEPAGGRKQVAGQAAAILYCELLCLSVFILPFFSFF